MKRLLSLVLPLVVLAACGANGANGANYCANWSCGGSSQCATVMGGPSGSQCGFGNLSDCQAWCHTYIPGNCSCSGGGGGGTPPTLSYLTVTPDGAVLAIGATQQYTATAHFSDGSTADVTAQSSWAVASVSGTGVASITAGGLVTARALGTATVSATEGGHSATATLTTSPVAITSIDVAPANPTIAKGQTQRFTATAHWSDGSTTDVTSTAGWFSSTSAATMAGPVATAMAAGTSTITAYQNGKSGSTVLTVTGAALVSVVVRPGTPGIAAGTSRQLTAIGTYTDGTAQDVTAAATWTSSVTSVATIGDPGVANAIAPGTAVVSASFADAQGLATVTVTSATLQTVSVSPAAPSVGPGETLAFSAIGAFSDGTSYAIPAGVTWASDAPATVSIGAASGVASTVAAGTASISATVGGATGSTPVTVSSSPPGTTWTWHPTGITEPTGAGVSAGSYSLNAIVWTGSQLVAAGTNRQLLTSPDGLAWTYHAPTSMAVSGFTYAPELGLLVAVGGGAWTSPDGVTWTQTLSSAGLSSVAWSGTLLVAVGSHSTGNALVYTSPDGVTWTQRNPGTTQVLDAVAWNGAQFVAVGNATVASADGVHWALSPDTSNAASGIAWSGKTFVKVATSGGVRTSADGVNWTLVTTLPVTLNDVIWADNRFVIVGGGGNTTAAFTSTDGVSWTARTIGITGLLGAPVLNAVAWTGTRFVAVGTFVNPVNPADGNYSIELSP